MVVNDTVKDLLTRQAELLNQNIDAYYEMVKAIAAGEKYEDQTISDTCRDADKSMTVLEKDLGLQQKRLQWRKEIKGVKSIKKKMEEHRAESIRIEKELEEIEKRMLSEQQPHWDQIRFLKRNLSKTVEAEKYLTKEHLDPRMVEEMDRLREDHKQKHKACYDLKKELSDVAGELRTVTSNALLKGRVQNNYQGPMMHENDAERIEVLKNRREVREAKIKELEPQLIEAEKQVKAQEKKLFDA